MSSWLLPYPRKGIDAEQQRYLNKGLCNALENGRIESVQMFIEDGADPNSQYSSTGETGRLPLEIAAAKDNTVAFDYLLWHGADPKRLWDVLMEKRPESLLRFFAKYPKLSWARVLDSVPDPELDAQDLFNLTSGVILLETKKRSENTEIFLESLIWLDKFDWLHPEICVLGIERLIRLAVEHKSVKCLKVLLEKVTRIESSFGGKARVKSDVPLHVVCDWRDGLDRDVSPLHVASSKDDLDMVMFLLERGEMCLTSKCGMLPIDCAYKEWSTNVLRFFLQNGHSSDLINRDKLHVACFLEDVASVKILIKGGADVNAADCEGRSPLIIAIKMKNSPLIKLLGESGAHPEKRVGGHPCAIEAAALAGVLEGNEKLLSVILKSYPGKMDSETLELGRRLAVTKCEEMGHFCKELKS